MLVLAKDRYILNVIQDDDQKDFERWSVNCAARYFGESPYLGYLDYETNKANVRTGDGSVKFTMKPLEPQHSYAWVEWQYYMGDRYWLSEECDPEGSLCLWVKGDGSGKELTVVFREGTFNVVFTSSQKIKLDSTEWKLYELPFSSFKTASDASLPDAILTDYWHVLVVYIIGFQANAGDSEVVFFIDGMEADAK